MTPLFESSSCGISSRRHMPSIRFARTWWIRPCYEQQENVFRRINAVHTVVH